MGYRSEVLIKVPTFRFEEFKQRANRKFNAYGYKEDVLAGAIITEFDETEYFVATTSIRFEWIKWYDSFSDVKSIMKTLEEMHNEYGMSYSFARSGEESGDIEEIHEEEDKEDKGKDVDWCYINISIV